MTVTYTLEVATSRFGRFLALLARWKGSIYKLVWREFVLFIFLYYLINLIYRFALPENHKVNFRKVVLYCHQFSNMIPLSFILGFYVTLVVGRWWDQFKTIPWPDRLALYVSCGVQGLDERGRLMRRTIMRYACLTYVITLSSMSPPVKKRFPSFTHMTEAGFMLPNEQKILEGIPTTANKYFIPLIWSASLATRARKEGRIKDDQALKTIVDEINAYRGACGFLLSYDWISIPLVYTQVVTLATYSYFLATLLGAQSVGPWIGNNNSETFDVFVPVFTLLQFFFYMGWLKVAETLVNPFGEDDDDFDINSLVDRNLQISYLVVDDIHQEHPELIRDQYWDEVQFDLPYTAATENLQKPEPFLGSAMDLRMDPKEKEFTHLESVIEGDENEQEETVLQKSFSTPAVGVQAVQDSNTRGPTVAASCPVEPLIVAPTTTRPRWSPGRKLRKFIRSFSKDSRRSHVGSNLSLASGKRSKIRGSASTIASQDQHHHAAVSIGFESVETLGLEDIFNMQDISDIEDSVDNGSRHGIARPVNPSKVTPPANSSKETPPLRRSKFTSPFNQCKGTAPINVPKYSPGSQSKRLSPISDSEKPPTVKLSKFETGPKETTKEEQPLLSHAPPKHTVPIVNPFKVDKTPRNRPLLPSSEAKELPVNMVEVETSAKETPPKDVPKSDVKKPEHPGPSSLPRQPQGSSRQPPSLSQQTKGNSDAETVLSQSKDKK